ncbi:YqaJ viral recombinase family protein [Kitasatospora griseola]|uniref:YqaJ viral recombinase family nuclease n=1 Tax=Kitasatospora griseola TaxID=2064 RepID=UPI0005C53A7B|nr:YqaJ viral recombinase family protein [Kitasatospora griseola]
MTITELPGVVAPPTAGPTVLGYFTPGSEEWHAARANGIGGSEIAAVVGLSPYESRFSLWHRKQGLLAPVEESPQMYWGKVHEPNILAEFAKRHPEFSVRQAPTYAAADDPGQIANPDGLLTPSCDCGLHRKWCCDPSDCGPCCENCPTCPTVNTQPTELVEAKTAIDDEGWGVEGTDEIPVYYRCQCLWYLDVLGLTRCHVAVLIGGWDYREYVVEYDAAEAQILREAGARFMQTVHDDERPNIDGHSATYQAIRVLPEGLDDVNVEIPAELRDRFHAAQDQAWAAEDELAECKGRLLDAIGTGRRAVSGSDRVATRTVRNGRTYQLLPARTRRTAR